MLWELRSQVLTLTQHESSRRGAHRQLLGARAQPAGGGLRVTGRWACKADWALHAWGPALRSEACAQQAAQPRGPGREAAGETEGWFTYRGATTLLSCGLRGRRGRTGHPMGQGGVHEMSGGRSCPGRGLGGRKMVSKLHVRAGGVRLAAAPRRPCFCIFRASKEQARVLYKGEKLTF